MRHTGFAAAAAAAIALSLPAAPAQAICSIFLHPVRTVGDTASDSACSDNDIQSAIDNADPNCTTDIAITREHIWNNQHLTINGKSVNFVGQSDGVTCNHVIACNELTPCPTSAVVSLNAGGSGRALTITGNSYVVLGGITVTGGNTGGDGGGIAFDGSGALTLYSSTVVNNTAANGGGIAFNGSGNGATLTLESNTLIVSNTANGSGGGVRVSGNAKLYTLLPQTLIGYNHAPNGYGGGVQVVGPATADIGSPGYGNGGVIFFNDAAYGGGLSLAATSDAPVAARLFSIDPTKPARISQNFASHTGGAVHMKPMAGGVVSFGGDAELCAYGFRLDGNAAQEGSAIYGDTDPSAFYDTQTSHVYLDRVQADLSYTAACGDSKSIADLGAQPCAPGFGCNEIDANVAQDANGTATAGSAILLQNQGSLQSTALDLRGNSGASALRTFDSGVSLVNCIAVDGNYTGPLFKFENQGQINGGADTEHVANCTFANNALGGAVIQSGYGLTLHDSLVVQPGAATLAYTGPRGQLDVAYVLSNDTATLPNAAGVMQGAPTFVDAAHGDYHQTRASVGVDYAPPVSGDDRDLEGYPRDQDLPTTPNLYGVRDLGAYERQTRYCGGADTFFCDGFDMQ